jgi:hypothetical protein
LTKKAIFMTNETDEAGAHPVKLRRAYGTGFAVVLLYVFFVFAVFAGFASYLTRTELEAQFGNGSGATRGLDDLIYLLKREDTLQRNIDAALRQIQAADTRVEKAKTALAGLTEDQNRHDRSQNALAVRTLVHLRRGLPLWDEQSSQHMKEMLEEEIFPTDLDRLRSSLSLSLALKFSETAEADAISQVSGHLKAASQELSVLDAKLRDIGTKMLGFQSDMDSALGARSWPQKQRDQFEKELNALRSREPADSSNRARISALSQLYGGGLFLELVSMPTIFLTLIVTMAAGGLGTVVSYTRNLQTRERMIALEEGQTLFVDDFSRLFVGVGEGIAAALAIFLLAGAGMLVLTNGNGPNGKSEISPYTVAFIAFLSGFMAEHAFIRIQKTGKELFAAPKKDAGKPPEAKAAEAQA